MPYDYEKPIALRGGIGLTDQINAGWGWSWKGRERATSRVRTYYTRTSFGSKGELIDAMEHHFPGIEFLDGAPADKEPKIVLPMPPHVFQHGIMKLIEQEKGDVRSRSPFRTLPIKRERIKPAQR